MSTLGVFIAVGITLLAVALGIALRRMTTAGLRFRGQRVVTCPEDHQTAAVNVDASHAALTAWNGGPELRLSGCSHWPERAGCGQPCITQIQAAPEDCLVRNILDKWCDGKCCIRCGGPIGEASWAGVPPVLLTPDGSLMEWQQIAATELPATLATAKPVCVDCYLRAAANPPPLKLAAS